MSATESPPTSDPVATEFALARLESEIARQEKSIRRTQQGFTLFAAGALIIALVNLVVIGAKMGTKDIHVTATAAPAAAGTSKAATPAPVAPHSVNVSLKEFSVNPSSPQAAGGKVTFHVRNTGSITHEFVVLKTNKDAGALLKGARADESGNVGETGDLQAGASKTIALKLAPGHYALICNLPGHYKAGQYVNFTVK
ncbi:MAG TPA: cupredoxin domain-containing protein [Thermoleophilaceae bacterium]|jgi:uncharacterized cupredoxin-like copper-binding protein